jgi:sugar phosphate isomerase/epimerase
MADFLYCLNASTIRPTPILEKIAAAGDAGYAGIELWHDDIDAYLATGGRLSDICHALDDHELELPTTIFLKGWFDTVGAEHATALDECKRRLNQAAELGAVHAIAAPPRGKVDFPLGAQHYRALLELGLAVGVKPAMEYLGFVDEFTTIEHALRVITDAGHPAGTIVLDPFHCYRGGGPLESILKLQAGQIAISHFNDSPASPPRDQLQDPDRVMPGEGVVDLKKYLDLLRQVGYNRWLSLELFRQDLWDRDPREVARAGLDKMRSVAES